MMMNDDKDIKPEKEVLTPVDVYEMIQKKNSKVDKLIEEFKLEITL